MGAAIGSNLCFGTGVESVFGTPVAMTRWFEVLSESLERRNNVITSNGIRCGSARNLRRGSRRVISSHDGGGTITMEVATTGFGRWFEHLLGGTPVIGAGPPYCVDEETEILTATGWKRYDALRVGDEALTLNHETGMSEWQSVLEVCVFPAERRELVLMEGRGHSSLSTPNHRWPVIAPHGANKRFGTQRLWKTTETLGCHDQLVLGAACADLPEETKWSDAFVELVAWFITEGTVRGHAGMRITKTLARADGEHVKRIDAALRRVFGPPVESLLPVSAIPRWRRDTENGKTVRFALNVAAGALLTHVAPDRVVERSFLYQLTQAQLELFIRTALTDNAGPTRFVQKDRRSAEAFQLAAILAGYGTSILLRRHARGESWIVTLQLRGGCKPADADRVARLQGREYIRKVDHDGIVWCPRTPNGSWLAKRNGSVYFTGNTHTYAMGNLAGKSLTIQKVLRDSASTEIEAFNFHGCKILSGEFSISVDQILQLTVEIDAEDVDTTTAGAAASYTNPVLFNFQGGTLNVAGSPVAQVTDASIKVTNNLKTDRYYLGSAGLKAEPIDSDFPTVDGSLSAEFISSATFYDRFAADSAALLSLVFVSGTSSLTISVPEVRFTGGTPTVGGPDVVVADVPFEGQYDGTNPGVSILYTTADAAT